MDVDKVCSSIIVYIADALNKRMVASILHAIRIGYIMDGLNDPLFGRGYIRNNYKETARSFEPKLKQGREHWTDNLTICPFKHIRSGNYILVAKEGLKTINLRGGIASLLISTAFHGCDKTRAIRKYLCNKSLALLDILLELRQACLEKFFFLGRKRANRVNLLNTINLKETSLGHIKTVDLVNIHRALQGKRRNRCPYRRRAGSSQRWG